MPGRIVTPAYIARRYAEAFFNVFPEAFTKKDCARLDELARFFYERRPVLFYLRLEGISSEHKVAVLEKALHEKQCDALAPLVKLLAQAGRLFLIPEVAEYIARICKERAHIVAMTCITVDPLTDHERKIIIDALMRVTKKDIEIHEKIDTRLIAGVRLQSDELLFDMSVRRALTFAARVVR